MNQAERAADILGGRLAAVSHLSGGSLSDVLRLRLEDGREAVVKGGPAPRTEAAMLNAIRASGAPAPKVLAVDDTVLVLELLPDSESLSSVWSDLGRALRRLHAAEGKEYGWDADYAFASVVIENARNDDWLRFWGEKRLLTSVPFVSADLARRLERLAVRLPDLLPAHPKPSLLHGDLWTGNVLTDGARVSGLIDPASYYGDGEVDLAMLHLFGAPPEAFYDAYGELSPGWRERRAAYTLWPALVHLRLFGAGYRGLVEGLLSACGT
jgi:fructosamine-3-kinase